MSKARIAATAACVTAFAAATVVAAATTAPAVSALSAPVAAASVAAADSPRVVIAPGDIRLPGAARQAPLTTAQCEKSHGIACYSPNQLRTAYHLPAVYAKGITGKGQTIVIVDSFGSPTIKADLATFDRHYGYAAPPKFTIITPSGKIPAFNPGNSDMSGWAGETTLDVEYAHSLAPGASILLVETPVSETEGTTGFPQIVKAEEYVINHKLGGVISQSFSATEENISSAQVKSLRGAIVDAYRHGVTVLAASGDAGATDYQKNGSDYYLRRVISWPDSDPWVTAVGGTQLKESSGRYTSVAWNDTRNQAADWYWGGSTNPDPLASGGGRSEFFGRPSYQNQIAVKKVTGATRGVPDIAMSAACNGAVNIYSSFTPRDAGWSLTCGTSEATPEFAAIVSLADQVAGHPLGLINPILYKLLAERAPGLVDVTSGNNTVSFYQGTATKRHVVTGYPALKGYDLVTGVGTINASKFVYELAGKEA